jgi:hypothetical protein
LDRIISKDVLLYAGISRGIKGGGFNSNVTAGTANGDVPFRSEKMFAYEIGEKITMFDHRLRVNSSVFYYDYRPTSSCVAHRRLSVTTTAISWAGSSKLLSIPCRG